MRRVVITGMGITSPIGNTLESVTSALRSGRSGIQVMPGWREVPGLRSHVAGVVEGIEPKAIPRKFRRSMGRMALLAAFAARDAVADAGLDEALLASARTGVAFGSTTGSGEVIEGFFSDYLSGKGIEGLEGTLFLKMMGHSVAANVASFLGTRGQLLAPSSACAASTQAIGLGFDIIRSGRQDVMICGGADDLHPSTAGVFDIVHAASKGHSDAPEKTPRPFDRDRDGLVVSEGGAALVLEAADHARARGAPSHGELLAYATCCDGRHMTCPHQEGMLRCMRDALREAGLEAHELDYVNAHATGTQTGDPVEAEALRELLGDRVPVSGTKGHTGHTLAACGAMEVIFCLAMMRGGFIAPTLNLEDVDPACAGLRHVQVLEHATLTRVMTSNFAFGGVNATLILGR